MKQLIYVAILIAVVIGIFYFVPQNDSTSTSTSTNTTKETPAMTTDPTTFEKISATSAVIKTDKGDITLELYPNDAPKTVTNFATLAKNGYYDGLVFHRVEIGIIQGGDPNGTGTGGSSIYGAKFEDELNPETASFKTGYVEGVIAMANAGPNTNGSQFFINQVDNTTKFAKNYTIFGKVTAGMDVVKKIAVGDKIQSIEVK